MMIRGHYPLSLSDLNSAFLWVDRAAAALAIDPFSPLLNSLAKE